MVFFHLVITILISRRLNASIGKLVLEDGDVKMVDDLLELLLLSPFLSLQLSVLGLCLSKLSLSLGELVSDVGNFH